MGKEYEFIYLLKEDIQKILNITNHQGNANQTTMRCCFTTTRMTIIKKSDNNKCWNCNPFTLAHHWWTFKWYSCCGKQLTVPQKVKHRVIWSSNSTSMYTLKENENIHSHKSCSWMTTAIIHSSQKIETT